VLTEEYSDLVIFCLLLTYISKTYCPGAIGKIKKNLKILIILEIKQLVLWR
jgi:hypothetical protein